MPTFVVSLFLPYTVDFHELPTPARRPSPPPRLGSVQKQPSTTDVRSGRPLSLFGQTVPVQTPSIQEHEDFFKVQPSIQTHFPKPHDPRAIVRSDSHMPEWGTSGGPFFNQPRSTAAPAPSDDVRDYKKLNEKLNNVTAPKKHSPPARSRDQSKARKGNNEWTVEPAVQGNGGLANAVRAAVDQGNMNDIFWVGTIGFPTDTLAQHQKDEIHEKLESEYDALTVYVNDSDLDGHYTHYCKTILWPVFHYQIPDHPKSKAYQDHSWIFYVNLNQAFANKIIANYKRGDIIWVHGYHLLLVPNMVRKALPDAEIGFFLHTAMPSSEVFRVLSTRKELLEGMLGANLIAFQTPEYAYHFAQTCGRILVVEATERGIQLDQRFVDVMALPIGIDPKGLDQLRQERDVQDWIKIMEERYRGKQLIVARDKLDNVRGVRQKLLAFELFLNKYPEWREKVVLIQVATSTADDTQLAETVADIVTRIDSAHSTLAHQPLVFLRQDIAFSQYLALLSVADVLMITSLREGMNLTCHEYIYCQDGALCDKKHGPVILSEFTGSADIFSNEQFISVNPWNFQGCANAIKKALEMDPAEKKQRHEKMRSVVTRQTGGSWSKSLVENLSKVHEEQYRRNTLSIPRLSVSQLADKYKSSNKRLFLLDYEGTLTPYGSPAKAIGPGQERPFDALNNLTADPKNMIYILSGHRPEELEFMFSRVQGLGFVAENGCFVQNPIDPDDNGTDPHQHDWITFADMAKMEDWKKGVRGILQYYQERVEGSWIEERHCSLIFHYEKSSDLEAASRQAGDCANHISDACRSQRIRAVPSRDCVVVEPIDWSKGTAARHIWNSLKNKGKDHVPDLLMVAGNDRDDEVTFKWADEVKKSGDLGADRVTTVSVGRKNTIAGATLTQGTTGLLACLQRLATPQDDRGRARAGSLMA